LLQQVTPPSASGSDTGPGNMRGLAIAPVAVWMYWSDE
jgi:hypothetical protein